MERTKIVVGENGAETVPLTDADIAQEKADAESFTNEAWIFLRHRRNAKLAETDWMATSDYTMSDPWKTYRQALRDLPANTADPANPTWPEEPS